MFLERLSVYGISDSKYYQTQKFNKGLNTDLDMPNCVQYCVCRAYESTQVKSPFIMFKNRSAGGYPDAPKWYDETILPKGPLVKVGSILCFDNHVAFVERENADGTFLISDSRYDPDKSLRNDRYFRTLDNIKLKVGQKPNISGVGVLLGCIYLPIQDKRTARNTKVEQIELIDDYVNVRDKANGDILMKGCYAPRGIFNVITSQMQEGYYWYQIDENSFVRSGEWLKHYSIEDDSTIELKKEIERLTKKLNQINKLSEV